MRGLRLGLGLSAVRVAQGGGGEPEPIIIPDKMVLAPLTARSTLSSAPHASFTDVAVDDHPFGEATALQLTPAAANTVYELVFAFSEPLAIENGTLELALKPMAHINQLNLFDIRLYSTGAVGSTGTDYHKLPNEFGVNPSLIKEATTSDTGEGRWQIFGYPVNEMVANGAGANMSAIQWGRMRFRNAATANILTARLGGLRFQPNPLQKAVCLLFLEDAHDTLPDFEAIADPYGFKLNISPGAWQVEVGAAGRLSEAQLLAAIGRGHAIIPQAWSSEEVQSQEDVDALKAKFIALGIPWTGFGTYYSNKSPKDLTSWPVFRDNYPKGVRTSLTPRGGTPAVIFAETYPWPDFGYVRALAGDAAGFAGWRAAHIDQAKASKGVCVGIWHRTPTGFQEFCDALAARADDIDVVTVPQFFARFA